MNSQRKNTNSKGGIVLKNRFETFVLKISGIQKNLTRFVMKNSLNMHLRLKISYAHKTNFLTKIIINCIGQTKSKQKYIFTIAITFLRLQWNFKAYHRWHEFTENGPVEILLNFGNHFRTLQLGFWKFLLGIVFLHYQVRTVWLFFLQAHRFDQSPETLIPLIDRNP